MATDLITFRQRIGEQPALPVAEYERRVATARRAMAEEGLDALLLFDPQSVCYFTGYTSVNLWDFCAVLIPSSGTVRTILWDFELPRYEASAAIGDPVTYAAHANTSEAVVTACRGFRIRTYAVDLWAPRVSVETWDRIRQGLEPAVPRDARRVLWSTRLRKSPVELAALRESAALTDLGVVAAAEAVRPGAIDREIAAAAAGAMLAAGAGHFSIQPIVAVGPRAGVAHSECSGRAVEEGAGVFLELGAPVKRYTAPVMRTVVAGEPSKELTQLASVASTALEEVVRAMRPGVTCAEVARVAHEVIRQSGSGVLFHGYVGYPIGVSFPPSWLEDLAFHIHLGNGEVLEEGMAFHLPISLRKRGEQGVGLSYSVVITSRGAEVLTGSPATLIVR